MKFHIFHMQRGQNGVIAVAAALLLPVILCMTGLALDAGNLYVHKWQLQNAADAAALAGAHQYVLSAESVSSHPNADRLAKAYAQVNDSSDSLAEGYQAKTLNKTTYYRVKLAEDVPLFFLKWFKDSQRVEVASCASIADSGNNTSVFIFTKGLSSVNSIDNPDNFNTKGQIKQTFDGGICYTDGSGKNTPGYNGYNITYSAQTNSLSNFFTTKAKTENCSVNEAVQDNYVNKPSYLSYDITALGTAVQSMTLLDTSSQNINTSAISLSNGTALHFTQAKTPNVTINVDQALPGSDSTTTKDSPVYLLIDNGIGVVNLSLSADTGRPLIICYMGTGQFHVSLGGHTFRGIIYAPYVCDEGVLLNESNGIFSGSIIAQSINLRGAGIFRSESFTGTSSYTPATGSPVIQLSDEDIDWDD